MVSTFLLKYLDKLFHGLQDGSTNVEESYIDWAASAEHFPSIWQVRVVAALVVVMVIRQRRKCTGAKI